MEYKLRFTNYRYRFQNDWAPFAYSDAGSRLANESEMKARLGEGAGLPLIKEGDRVWSSDDTEHTLIIGETGSKKTRCAIMPLIYRLAQAGESMVITDVKGELSSNPKLSALLAHEGYEVRCLDFRSFAGDGYNVYEEPFRLYCNKEKDKAMAQVCDFSHSLVHRNGGSKPDKFWDDTSETYMNTVTNLLMEVCSQKPQEYGKYVNMATICKFTTYESATALEDILGEIIDDLEGQENNTVLLLKSVLCASDRTLSSIMITVAAHIKDFMMQKSLMEMLSTSTFETDLYNKKMAIFVIVPDEVGTYDSIAGQMVNSIYTRSVQQHTECYQNTGVPVPRRINFILDEFCNLKMPDMGSKISACRSRNIRFFLVVQSMAQLMGVYADVADVFRGNCKNVLFLQSSDPDTLGYVQRLCGVTYVTEHKEPEPLLSTEQLRRLQKTWDYKEAVQVHGETVYVAKLWDLDHYPETGTPPPRAAPRVFTPPAVYSPRQLELDYICHGVIACPFKEGASPKGRRPHEVDPQHYHQALENAFDELFGKTNND